MSEFIKKIKSWFNTDSSSTNNKIEYSKVEEEEYKEKLEKIIKEPIFSLPDFEKEIQQPEQIEENKDVKEVETAPDFNQFTLEAIEKRLSILRGNTTSFRVDEVKFHFEKRDILYQLAGGKDGIIFQPEFQTRIKDKLASFGVILPTKIKYTFEVPSINVNQFRHICEGVSIELIDYTSEEARALNLRMRLTAHGGVLEKYEHILKLRKEPYHVGKGKIVRLQNNIPHTNDIVFVNPDETENPNDELKNNKYISRLQFSIFSTNQSFYLKRTRLGFNSKSRVDIQRNDNGNYVDLPLNTTDVKITLQDGDIILINKKISMVVELYTEE